MLWPAVCLSRLAQAELGRDWVQATGSAAWEARHGQASAVYDGKMWVIGGRGAHYAADVWYSVNGTTWTLATTYPPWNLRYGHSVVVHNRKMWLLGGHTWEDKNDVWSSVDGLNWTTVTAHAAWSGRIEHTSVVYNGKMWVLGGDDGSLNPGHSKQDVWYSSDGVRWTSATLAAPCRLGNHHTSVVYDGKIWVISNGVWSTTNGNTWTQVTADPPWDWPPYEFRQDLRAVVCDGRIWVMGGTGYSLLVRQDVWYSTNGKYWTCATPSAPWPGRILFGLVVHNRRMWILGGCTFGPKGTRPTLLNDVWYSSMPAAARAWKYYP
jgi:hypothetical protein